MAETPLLKSTATHFRKNPTASSPRIVRISVTDADATDSSSDDDEPYYSSEPRRVKRFIRHVTIEPQTTAYSPTTSFQVSEAAVLAGRVPLKRKRRRGNPRRVTGQPESESEKGHVEENPVGSLLPGDFYAGDVIFPPGFEFDLFSDLGTGFDQDLAGDIGSLFFRTCDLGLGISDATWHADDTFGSDPLVAS